jgi:hypothetical protein
MDYVRTAVMEIIEVSATEHCACDTVSEICSVCKMRKVLKKKLCDYFSELENQSEYYRRAKI